MRHVILSAFLMILTICLIDASFIKLEHGMIKDVNYNVHLIVRETNLQIPTLEEHDKEHPKVSVIIPVHNGGKTIRNCLRSIEHQNLQELEIIFVDDGSTDYSLKLMKELKQEDKRIRIIKNKKNKGILYSRINAALKAKGEYITFIDADDAYANSGTLKELYDKAKEKGLDFIQMDYFVGLYDGDEDFKSKLLATAANKDAYNKVLKQPEILHHFYEIFIDKKDSLSGVVFDKLYSKDLIKRMAKALGEKFWKEHFIYNEDFIMAFAAAKEAKKCMMVSVGGLWHWYDNPNGRTTGTFESIKNRLKYPEKTNKKLKDYLTTLEKAFDMTEKDPKAEEFRVSMLDTIIKPDDHRNIFSQTDSFEKIMELCKRFIKWDYASEKNIKYIKDFGRETISYTVDTETYKKYKMKYFSFYEGVGDL